MTTVPPDQQGSLSGDLLKLGKLLADLRSSLLCTSEGGSSTTALRSAEDLECCLKALQSPHQRALGKVEPAIQSQSYVNELYPDFYASPTVGGLSAELNLMTSCHLAIPTAHVHQVIKEEASLVQQHIKHLSEDAARLLVSLSNTQDLSRETAWLFLRPVLHLLLWLLPEHAPLPHPRPQLGQLSTAASHNRLQASAAEASAWESGVTRALTQEAATVSAG
jgi:hypothetical protein